MHSPHHLPFENQRGPICSDGRSAGKGRTMIKGCGRISSLSLQLHLNAAREQTGARSTLVSDVIIAGWGVVVSLSRLKWKIAPHILGKRVCCVTCLQNPPPKPLYPCRSGSGRPAGTGTPVSSPNPLGSFLPQFKCAAVPVVLNIGSGLFALSHSPTSVHRGEGHRSY